MAEWPNARDCKSRKPSVQIRPLPPTILTVDSFGERLGLISPGERSDGLQRIGSNPISTTKIRVAQLDRASVYETEGWGFEFLRGYQLSQCNCWYWWQRATFLKRLSTPRHQSNTQHHCN